MKNMAFLTKFSIATFVLQQPEYHHLKSSTPVTTNTFRTVPLQEKNINIDETTGKCKFGIKQYWDDMYKGTGDRPSQSYSWYCGWEELGPFWKELVPDTNSHVLIAGIGNDPTPIRLYDVGWKKMTAFDYSQAGVERAKSLFGPDRGDVTIINADARNLPIEDGTVNAILDKGTLDAIYITGEHVFHESVEEFTRVTALGGVFVCVSNVILPEVLLSSFESSLWENIHDGGLAFTSDGEATIDLGAYLFSWRRI